MDEKKPVTNIAAVLSTVELMKNTFRHFQEAEQVLEALRNVEQLVADRKEVLRRTNEAIAEGEKKQANLDETLKRLAVAEQEAAQRTVKAIQDRKRADEELKRLQEELADKFKVVKQNHADAVKLEQDAHMATRQELERGTVAKKASLGEEIKAEEDRLAKLKAARKALAEEALKD